MYRYYRLLVIALNDIIFCYNVFLFNDLWQQKIILFTYQALYAIQPASQAMVIRTLKEKNETIFISWVLSTKPIEVAIISSNDILARLVKIILESLLTHRVFQFVSSVPKSQPILYHTLAKTGSLHHFQKQVGWGPRQTLTLRIIIFLF